MRIIEEGPLGGNFEVTCRTCASRLAVSADDVLLGVRYVYTETEEVYYIVCPVCNNDHDFGRTTSKLPQQVRERVRKRYNR